MENDSTENCESRPLAEEQPKDHSHLTPTIHLRRSQYTLILVLVYIVLAVYAWATLCSQVKWRVAKFSDGLQYMEGHSTDYYRSEERAKVAEKHLRAARIIQSIVSLSTVPLISAVCVRAAVIYSQRRENSEPSITLRQTITLADRGWTDIRILGKLVIGKWRRYGSRLLLVAIMLNILGKVVPIEKRLGTYSLTYKGLVISPLQALLMSYKSIKYPSDLPQPRPMRDIVDQLDYFQSADVSLRTLATRASLVSVNR